MRSFLQMAIDIAVASQNTSRPPSSIVDGLEEEYEELSTVMTNDDHSIDDEVAEKLRTGKFWAAYTAENFYAFVFWVPEETIYRAHVKQYREYKQTVSGTLREIMEQLSDEYGWD